MFNNLHVLESLPAYVLGSLEEEEAQSLAEHVAGCYLCRSELDSLQRVADQLSLAVPEATPSPGLKPRLMTRIQTLNRQQPSPAGIRSFPKRLLPVTALAGLSLILVLAFSNLLLWQRMNNLEVLTGPLGMRAITLQNTDSAPSASGFVVISADGEDGVLVVDELPTLDESREYQVWLMRAGDARSTSGGVFNVDESGYRGLRIESPESLLSYSSVLVTIEPAGGSTKPTGESVLNGPLFNP
jgi:anti-sigma-K factor RskA